MLKLKNISDKESISLDLVCYLRMIPIIDNEEQEPVLRQVFCAELSIGSSEFYNAGQSGVKPEHLLVIDNEEYDGETSLVFDDIDFNIYRTYPRSDGLIELYCNKKAGVQ